MTPSTRIRLLHSVARGVWMLALAAILVAPAFAGATYDKSKHGHPETGVLRIPEEGRGACAQCHDEHGSRGGLANGGPFNRVLFTVDDETLCYSCHSTESSSDVYPGNVSWADSTHSTSPNAYWRGPKPMARKAEEAGRCVNCHDPHGADDPTGIIPSMMRLREEAQCTGCHDGVAAKDVKSQIAKAYGHPIDVSRRHVAAEGSDSAPAQYDDSGTTPRRHAECTDCHNPHVARADIVPPVAPEASLRNAGVARVRVVNGAAGTQPLYEWRGAVDVTGAREYEICFKCHSSWTTLPTGKPDLAVLTNPNNPSYHPIQDRGKNANIDPAAFVDGWSWDRTVHCSDCHGSDDPLVRGPHGSIHPSLLRAPAPDLCYSCHRFEVYGDGTASAPAQSASRFNDPAGAGHALHVGQQNVACAACHVTHGSTTRPALIATGLAPGIAIYTQTPGGGSCAPTCHAMRTYTVNYAR